MRPKTRVRMMWPPPVEEHNKDKDKDKDKGVYLAHLLGSIFGLVLLISTTVFYINHSFPVCSNPPDECPHSHSDRGCWGSWVQVGFLLFTSICQFYYPYPYLYSFSFSSLWLKSCLFLANSTREQKKIYFRALSYKMIIREGPNNSIVNKNDVG